jgi:hypothetical protein
LKSRYGFSENLLKKLKVFIPATGGGPVGLPVELEGLEGLEAGGAPVPEPGKWGISVSPFILTHV